MPFTTSSDFRFSATEGLHIASGIGDDLACPVTEDSHLWVDTVTIIAVSVQNTNPLGAVHAEACVLFDHAVGGACGASRIAFSIGHSVLTPPPTVWNQTFFGEAFAGDYPYLKIWMGGPTFGTQNNGLFRYLISN